MGAVGALLPLESAWLTGEGLARFEDRVVAVVWQSGWGGFDEDMRAVHARAAGVIVAAVTGEDIGAVARRVRRRARAVAGRDEAVALYGR